ncbi:hypothetical protein B1C78_11750 [Thioalkalivibrio denitrificans]|uniref:Uncharacterized protein n=1 Tax=Thioalkalivibrio denitrificans TaxID=108003 RepID=A0A1V3NER9_9GAMM|nr:hypothetical protein [Thioalkalivibrio denitrificans]OOG23286.1 hypothetical protein B1C78_11750 [Thioalkalivibrio denitrificans]
MPLDPRSVDQSFHFDSRQTALLRRQWGALMDTLVWGDVRSSRLGALPRLRKRFLELGENLRSVLNDRGWIPQPRERVKGAMGACLNLRDALNQVERGASTLNAGEDFPAFEQELLAFRHQLLLFLEHHESLWGDLLESQYDESSEDEEED